MGFVAPQAMRMQGHKTATRPPIGPAAAVRDVLLFVALLGAGVAVVVFHLVGG